MVQVGGDDARIVGPIPRTCGRIGNEEHPQIDRVRGWRPSHPAAPGDSLAAIAHQPLVDRSPPRTTRRRRIERRQHAAAELPAHERQSRPAKWQVPGCAADRTVIGPGDQLEARCRIVTHGLDLIKCPRRGGRSRTHAPIVGPTWVSTAGQAESGTKHREYGSSTPSRWGTPPGRVRRRWCVRMAPGRGSGGCGRADKRSTQRGGLA
jgi:hypothetical protein